MKKQKFNDFKTLQAYNFFSKRFLTFNKQRILKVRHLVWKKVHCVKKIRLSKDSLIILIAVFRFVIKSLNCFFDCKNRDLCLQRLTVEKCIIIVVYFLCSCNNYLWLETLLNFQGDLRPKLVFYNLNAY